MVLNGASFRYIVDEEACQKRRNQAAVAKKRKVCGAPEDDALWLDMDDDDHDDTASADEDENDQNAEKEKEEQGGGDARQGGPLLFGFWRKLWRGDCIAGPGATALGEAVTASSRRAGAAVLNGDPGRLIGASKSSPKTRPTTTKTPTTTNTNI
mmetsp:Transcript_16666/g.54266  ORF Transcript_16666/g.54266 Transcript_16666/m.54266 type:complete len:154 (-) Transcript_16666:427-888(-)